MTDIATLLDTLVPGAEYFGSLTGNTRDEYDALDWHDDRTKPEWSTLSAVDTTGNVKAELQTQVDSAAERERLKYITPGAGQAMTYWEKAAQARACLSDHDPDPADYPMLAAEIGITGNDLVEVATVVSGAYQAWLTIGSQIEAVRRGANVAIENAETAEAAQAAFAAIIWP